MFKRVRETAMFFLALGLATFLVLQPVFAAAETAAVQTPSVSSQAAVLMDADTGEILYEKSKDEVLYPASITKILTVLLAIEHCSPDESVTFTETGTRDTTGDSSNIGMQVGEILTMKDCWYAAIIQSANEVCAQIAEYVGGTESAFIDMMNARAQELGCTNTHFANASGLPDANHYTTASDMAKIMQACLKNETFREVISAAGYIIPATNLSAERALHTHVPLIASESDLYYQDCIGGKTGNTVDAGHTMVVAAERNGKTYIAVTLKAADLGVNCSDSIALFDYAFANYASQPTPTPTAAPTATPTPVPSGTEQEISAQQTSEIPAESNASAENFSETEDLEGISLTAKILLGVMAAMFVLLIGLMIALHKKDRK